MARPVDTILFFRGDIVLLNAGGSGDWAPPKVKGNVLLGVAPMGAWLLGLPRAVMPNVSLLDGPILEIVSVRVCLSL